MYNVRMMIVSMDDDVNCVSEEFKTFCQLKMKCPTVDVVLFCMTTTQGDISTIFAAFFLPFLLQA